MIFEHWHNNDQRGCVISGHNEKDFFLAFVPELLIEKVVLSTL